MIIHDYECQDCGLVYEAFIKDSNNIPKSLPCPKCDGYSVRIVSMSQTSPVDAPWLHDTLAVVDKHPDKPHCQEFLKHPTRANYQAWMKGEGIRPLEPGEPTKPKDNKKKRMSEIKKGMLEKFSKRNAVSVGGM